MEKRTRFFNTNIFKRNPQKPESSEEKGWGNTTDDTMFNGWGSSLDSTNSEPITNGWADEPPENHFNGWGPACGSNPSHRPPSLETTSNEWTHEKPKDQYNGWGFGSCCGSRSSSGLGSGLTILMDELHVSRPQKVESWVPTIPSAPPLLHGNSNDKNKVIANVSNKDTVSLNEGKSNDALCVVCWEARVEGACVPCGHMASCMACLHEIESKQGTCPICRTKIDKVMRIYTIQTE